MTARDGLLVDFGGVLTTNVFESFAAFCRAEGLDADTVRDRFREDQARASCSASSRRASSPRPSSSGASRAMLGVAEPAGLIDRLFAGMQPDEAMLDAVAAARRAGVRTGLVSNSWGEEGYDRTRFDELFDVLVISGEVGIRKPAPGIYALAAERIGRAAGALRVRRRPARQPQARARRSGWRPCCTATPRRRSRELEELLGVSLR